MKHKRELSAFLEKRLYNEGDSFKETIYQALLDFEDEMTTKWRKSIVGKANKDEY